MLTAVADAAERRLARVAVKVAIRPAHAAAGRCRGRGPCRGRALERARHQRELEDRFHRYSYLDGGPLLVPKWLRTSLGDDFFAEMEGIAIQATRHFNKKTRICPFINSCS
jgi:hypothetical protein